MPLPEIAAYLSEFFRTERYPTNEQGGIWHPTTLPIHRFGLALEPNAGLLEWVLRKKSDALWLHRPWSLDLNALPPGVGVLTHHLPFDETLTLGYNPRLAVKLGLSNLEEIGHKQAPDLPARAIGMIGHATATDWLQKLNLEFGRKGGSDLLVGVIQHEVSHRQSTRIAVVGAMTEALVREAAERGATVYVTGQYRQPARQAVEETGLSVVEIGHRPSEVWGLRALAEVLRERWPCLEITIYPNFLTNSAEALSA
ncbi:MAG: Nif3-like dinuclear metal center hexameric protein [Sphingobacteriaceae bacterium]|nr:Nif3-like dinuclear metal center hexameric protein [Cytophagaceae bacterium]